MRIPALLVAALAAATTAAAADRPCTQGDAAAAGKAIDRVMNWQQLRKSWQDYGQCDSGGTADLYTDTILRLAVDWKDVDALASEMKGDRAYHDFVLAHLKSDAAKEDRDAVYSRAKKSCPAGQDAFCAEIAAAVKGPSAAKGEPDTLDLTPIQTQPAKKK
jgi:hypothetical protein